VLGGCFCDLGLRDLDSRDICICMGKEEGVLGVMFVV
jgi:hypothetical protein